MKVLVSDTSVLIDLERGELLEAVFKLAVPDLLFARELRGHGGERLVELGLRVEELDADGVRRAIDYRRARRTLSLPDVFALELARRHGWILLTGDAALRALAGEQQVDCHGVLWVLDRMQDEAVVNVQALLDGLRRIEAHPRCRLPKRDMRIRLERYVKSWRSARARFRAGKSDPRGCARSNLSPEMALRIEVALGPKADVMMGIQTDYAMARARARLPEITATVRRIAPSTS
jgi:hypothetical protein